MTDTHRILLVGSSGRVGRMIHHHWRKTLPQYIEVVEQHRDPNKNEGVFWPLHLPLDNSRLVAERINSIICLAGVTPGPGADLSQNDLVAGAVLQAAHRASIPRVLIASSSAVYGARKLQAYQETDATAPLNEYGKAKVAMETTCMNWATKGLEVCSMRIGNVAGADALLLNVANTAPSQSIHIDSFADQRGPLRSYIGAGTLADVLINLATSDARLPSILNIAAPKPIYMEDLAKAAGHPYTLRPSAKGAVQRITLDCNRLAARYSFESNASAPTQMVKQWKETLTS